MIEVRGLDELIRSIEKMAVIDVRPAVSAAASTFADKLRAGTPVGYSGKLKSSVVQDDEDEHSEVGYEAGVETAGDPELDSVIRPKKAVRSVLVWTRPKELAGVLAATFDSYEGEGVLSLETRMMEAADGVT